MDQKMLLTDRHPITDQNQIRSFLNNRGGVIKGTNVMIVDPITGKPLVRKSNKVILPGSSYVASKIFGINKAATLPSYNEAIGLDSNVTTAPTNDEIVCLFAVGVDGAGAESSQILDVDYSKWCAPENLVPIRYVSRTADISDDEKDIYFGKKTLTNNIAYYFKAFEATPVMYMQHTDGTPVDATIYNSTNSLEVECFVELNLKITKEDCREYFIETIGLSEAKVNTIELLTAWYTTDASGHKVYQNIQPITKLNIATESLSDETKGLDIIYHIYF